MRLPKRSWVRSLGGFSFASRPSRWCARRAREARRRRRPGRWPSRRPRGEAPPSATRVGLEGVVALQRRGLVEDLVGRFRWLAQATDMSRFLSGHGSNAEVSKRGDHGLWVVLARGGGDGARRELRRSRPTSAAAAAAGSCSGSSPAGDTVGDHLGKGVAVGAAEDEGARPRPPGRPARRSAPRRAGAARARRAKASTAGGDPLGG